MAKGQRRVKRLKRLKAERASGRAARAGQTRLTTHNVGVLPILNRVLEQMKLEEFLQDYLPNEDGRTKLRSYRALMVLIRNTLAYGTCSHLWSGRVGLRLRTRSAGTYRGGDGASQ